MQDLDVTIGDRDGKVIVQFNRPVKEFDMDVDLAMAVGEKLARSAFSATHNRDAPSNKSVLSELVRSKLITRVTHIMVSLSGKNKNPSYIAKHVVDTVLSEVL